MITPRRLVLALLVGAAALAGGFALVAQGGQNVVSAAKANQIRANVYSVKFLCGVSTAAPPGAMPPTGLVVEPGSYQTVINVHNPTGDPVTFFKKAVVMAPAADFEQPKPPSPFHQATLDPNWGLVIDCDDIKLVLTNLGVAPAFFDGFVVLVVPDDRVVLDVVAAYTVSGLGTTTSGPALDVEDIEPKRVQTVQPTVSGTP